MSPIEHEPNFNSDPEGAPGIKENDFEQKKLAFIVWAKEHIEQLYNNKYTIHKEDYFNNPVDAKIESLFPNDTGYILKEHAEMIKIFADHLIDFNEGIIFEKDFSPEKHSDFLGSLYKLYFNRSPDVLECLKINYIQKTITSSKINETYGISSIVDTAGHLSYDLSFADKNFFEYFNKEVEGLSISDKISVIKQLAYAARWAHGNGSWASEGYRELIKTLKGIQENDDNPLIKFYADFELKKIENYTGELTGFNEGVYFLPDSDKELEKFNGGLPLNEEVIDFKTKIQAESIIFESENKLVPELKNVLYSRVSKDYGSVVLKNSTTPIALVDLMEVYRGKKENKEEGGNIVHIKSYEGITLQKDLNPFGDEDFSRLVKLLHSPEMRMYMNGRFKIRIEELSLRDQIHFLRFLSDSNEFTFARLEKILGKHEKKESLLRSFLSTSGDPSMGDKIITIGEKLPQKYSDGIFEKYGEIVDAVNEVADFVSKNLTTNTDEKKYIPEIIETLLLKGKQLIENSANRVSVCEKEEDCNDIGTKLYQELSYIKKEILLTASTFRAVSKEPGIKLADLKNISVEVTSNINVLLEHKEEMEKIFLENRKNYPKSVRDKSFEEFSDSIQNLEGREFYLLKDGKNILGFLRFDLLPNGNLYAASLNSRPEIRGMAMGAALLREVLDDKAKSNNIEAIVYGKNPMFSRYVSDEYKFKIDGEIENYEGTGEKFYKLLRTKTTT